MKSKQPAYAVDSSPGLERSGGQGRQQQQDWIAGELVGPGVARLQARLGRRAYARHRHDTYTIALTDSGVQEFDYRGSVYRSLPGQVVVLHPDEAHDGRAGTASGFSYRSVSLSGECMHAAVGLLPFVKSPVIDDPQIAQAIREVFLLSSQAPAEPLVVDELVQVIGERLAARAQPSMSARHQRHQRHLGEALLLSAREWLDQRFDQVVSATQMEQVFGVSRYCLAANFKRRFGTSPYRYALMRRIDYVRSQLAGDVQLAGLALSAGFSDQAHMTRLFKSVVGLTPDRYARLVRSDRTAPAYNQPRH